MKAITIASMEKIKVARFLTFEGSQTKMFSILIADLFRKLVFQV